MNFLKKSWLHERKQQLSSSKNIDARITKLKNNKVADLESFWFSKK